MVRPSLLVLILCFFFLIACRDNSKTSTDQRIAKRINTVAHVDKKSTAVHRTISKDQLLGKIDVKIDSQYILIPARYASRSNMYLQHATWRAFERMENAAKKDGIELKIVSAFRSFAHQKSIWEAKWTGKRKVGGTQLNIALPEPEARAKKILTYSSMPGCSRHHWGTDIDLNALENVYFEHGVGLRIYNWLQTHAADFGFCQVYSDKKNSGRKGYEEERWHWSYMPLASMYLDQYNKKIEVKDINGFAGSEAAALVDVIDHYVNGINTACNVN